MDASLARGVALSAALHALAAAAWSGSLDRPPLPLDVEAASFSLEWKAEGESGIAEIPSEPSPGRPQEEPEAPEPPAEPEAAPEEQPPEVLTRQEPEDAPDAAETPEAKPFEPAAERQPPSPVAPPEAPRATGAVVSFPVPEADNPAPRYPEQARLKGQEGRVVIRAYVRTDGSVERTEMILSSGHDLLDRAARRAVERWRFRPALLDGLPAPGEIDVPIQFVLKE